MTTMPAAPPQFKCDLPGCGKSYSRKEHLNRHLKSHGPRPQHQCPLCGRRYARSDVLKRHVENHPQPSNLQRKRRNGNLNSPVPLPEIVEESVTAPTSSSPNLFQLDGEYNSSTSNSSLYGNASGNASGNAVHPNLPLERDHSILASQDHPIEVPHSSEAETVTSYYVLLREDWANTRRLVNIFFTQIHQYWPLFHEPTFQIDAAPDILLASIVMLASLFANGHVHQQLSSLLFDEIVKIPLYKPSLHVLQSTLLYVIYATQFMSEPDISTRVLNSSALLVSSCRHLGILCGRYEDIGGDHFGVWCFQEQANRLAYAVLRIDAYLSLILDTPPTVRYHELCLPLPKSPELWSSAAEEERRRLQWNEPLGREKALFSLIVRDTVDFTRPAVLPYRLLFLDCHLVLCAIQTKVWELAKEVHSPEFDGLSASERADNALHPLGRGPKQWHDKVRKECRIDEQLPDTPALNDNSPFPALTLMMWHISALKVHAPLHLLRVHGHYLKRTRPSAVFSTRGPRARLLSWLSTICPRLAAWNAAQICRVYTIKAPGPNARFRSLLNPLAIPGVLMSAVVICLYAFHTRACSLCAAIPPTTSINLFDFQETEELENWKRDGCGLATWGLNQVPVCHCRVGELAAWFREALEQEQDQAAEMELVLFLAELCRE
ncbi:fungal-specific transcription factor domain-containing protein [Xylariaceae sp. FL1651]|nr:fungal-specific transcription factor domain-containing protein [Xylariaceae sp. FL1651]